MMRVSATPLAARSITETTPRPWLKHYDPQVPARLAYLRQPIYSILQESTARYPDRPCINFFGRCLTYAQVNELSDRLAAGLRRLGVGKGDRVALLLPNCPQFVIAYYGLLKAGAVVVPLNPLYTARELAFHFSDSAACAVITIPLFLAKVVGLRGETRLRHVICTRLADYLPFPLNLAQGWQELRAAVGIGRRGIVEWRALLAQPVRASYRPEPVDPGGMAALIYSGGTTGIAKGITLSHNQCLANAEQAAAWGHLTEQDRLAGVLPLFHAFGQGIIMNAAVLRGAAIVLLPRFKARDVLAAIQKYRATFFVGVPTMFVAFSQLPDLDRYDLTSLRGIFVGSAPLPRAIKEQFETRTGARMIEGYGLTEATAGASANPLCGPHKLGSVGIPFPDIDMKIVSLDDGRDLAPNESGEIVMRGPNVMLGYYQNPSETANALTGEWLHTGDIGCMDSDGYFYVTDRTKDIIIVGGYKVFPREIDELIYQHPKVKEGVAVGIPSDYKGECVKAYIVLKDGVTATEQEFISYFKERLVPYKVPAVVEFRRELPKSMIGKVLRRALREEELAKRNSV